MAYVVINALLYLALLLVYWKHKKVFDAGTLLICMWLVVAVAGVAYYLENPLSWRFQLWPFLFIFICFLLLSRYIFRYRFGEKAIYRLAYTKNRIIDILCWFYLICVVIKLINEGLNFSALSLLQVAEDSAEAYEDHLSYEFQGGPIAYIATVYVQYFSNACIIWGFNCLCQSRKLSSFLFLFFPFISAFGEGIFYGSRNTIVMAVMVYICAYVLYQKLIPRKSKIVIYISSSVVGIIVLLYLLAIAESRFGIDTPASEDNSILAYLGQSMLQFNYGLADTIRGTYDGAMHFKNLYTLIDFSVPKRFSADSMLGTHISTGFVTIVGFFVMDFGYIGTTICCILFPLLMKEICFRPKGFTLPAMYIFLFYLTRMMRGSMVFSGPGADASYFFAIIFAVLLKIAMIMGALLFKDKKRVNKSICYDTREFS